MNWQETREFLSPCFPEEVRAELSLLSPGELREIRVRAERRAVFVTSGRTAEVGWQPGPHQLEALVEALSGHSLYARPEETGQGYLTLAGGHRMGLCGRAILRDGRMRLTDVGSICLRIAGEWPGAADGLAERMRRFSPCGNLLIIGPPGSGKTTLLRDLARQLSTGQQALQTALIDERGEIAACLGGVPQLNVGSADVLAGLPKPQAVSWLMRSMAPQLIITDELASSPDADALMQAHAGGAAICASVHGAGLTQAASRPEVAALMSRRVFDLYAVLAPEGGARLAALYDRSSSPLADS